MRNVSVSEYRFWWDLSPQARQDNMHLLEYGLESTENLLFLERDWFIPDLLSVLPTHKQKVAFNIDRYVYVEEFEGRWFLGKFFVTEAEDMKHF